MNQGHGATNAPPESTPADNGQGDSAVGNLLRATRLRVGEDLRDVARILRIRYPYLEAIETGRYADLPGSAYAVGFVRGYAEHLGLDSEEIVRRFKAETANAAEKTDLVFPSPVSETVMPGGAVIFIGIVLAALAYGIWYVGTSEDSPLADLIGPLPERLSTLLNSPASAPEVASDTPEAVQVTPPTTPTMTDEEAETEAAEPEISAAPAPQTAQGDMAVPEVPRDTSDPVEAEPASARDTSTTATMAETPPSAGGSAVETPPEEAEPQPEQQEAATARSDEMSPVEVLDDQQADVTREDSTESAAPAVSEAELQAASTPAPEPEEPEEAVAEARPPGPKIEVRAKSPSWIQVRDDVAKTLIVTRLLRKGDTYLVPDRDGLSLVTGNAGALEILVDGEAVPAIGDAGAVRRSVALDAEKLKNGTAVSE